MYAVGPLLGYLMALERFYENIQIAGGQCLIGGWFMGW
jgi:hypothetical protein